MRQSISLLGWCMTALLVLAACEGRSTGTGPKAIEDVQASQAYQAKGAEPSAANVAAARHVNEVAAVPPLVSSGGTQPEISIPPASQSSDGYLSSQDWNTFSAKVGAVNAGAGISVQGDPRSPTVGVVFGQAAGTAVEGNDPRLANNCTLATQLAGAIQFTTQKFSGSQFVANLANRVKVCPVAFHVCNAWEYSTISILAQNKVPQDYGWIVGAWPSYEIHSRSLVDGFNSSVCPSGLHLISYRRCCTGNEAGWDGYFGRFHCEPDSSIWPVACCRDNLLGGL